MAEPDAEPPVDLGPRYRVGDRIGSGGAADVYRVWDEESCVERAAKVLRSDLHPEALTMAKSRFAREAKLLSRLRHRHLLRVYDVDLDAKRPFVITELCHGGSLGLEHQKAPMSVAAAVSLLAPIAAALSYMHRQGVVHRDVKPSNLLLDAMGRPRLCDLGIASMQGGDAITDDGTRLGTPSFMAPEQLMQANAVDGLADQYALAATLYSLVTHRSAHSLYAAGPDSVRWRTVDSELAAILQRATHYRKEQRYPSVDAFIQSLMFPKRNSVSVGASGLSPGLVKMFTTGLKGRASLIESALGRLVAETPGAIEELRRHLHSLVGAAGTYGFHDLSHQARMTEGSAPDAMVAATRRLLATIRGTLRGTQEPGVAVIGGPASLKALLTHAWFFEDWSAWDANPSSPQIDILLCDAAVTSKTQLAMFRQRSGVPVIMLDDDPNAAWPDHGADLQLATSTHPVTLVATLRGLVHPRPAIETDMMRFYDSVALRRHDVGGVRLCCIHDPGVPLGRLVEPKKLECLHGHAIQARSGVLFLLPKAASPSEVLTTASRKRPIAWTDPNLGASVGVLVEQLESFARALAPRAGFYEMPSTSKARLLTIEDDADVASVIQEVAQRSGLECLHAADGETGLVLAQSEWVDIVLLDVGLPGVDGWSVLRQLRSRPKTRDVKVMVVSANDSAEARVRALELGADGHLAKPFDVRLLDAQIRSMLRGVTTR